MRESGPEIPERKKLDTIYKGTDTRTVSEGFTAHTLKRINARYP